MLEQSPKFFTQANARSQLFELCRRVVDTPTKLYVKDKAGEVYLTLAPTIKAGTLPLVEVSAQRFKDEFSRFSILVKNGYCFKLRLRGRPEVLYARAHTSYKNPLSDVVLEGFKQLSTFDPLSGQDEDDVREGLHGS